MSQPIDLTSAQHTAVRHTDPQPRAMLHSAADQSAVVEGGMLKTPSGRYYDMNQSPSRTATQRNLAL